MEHILLPGTIAPITTPFLATEAYDNGDFLTYPERKGWDVSSWRECTLEEGITAIDCNSKSLHEVSGFIQSWLYIGLCNVCFGNNHIEVDEFVRKTNGGDIFITTVRLHDYLNVWEQRDSVLADHEKRVKSQELYVYIEAAKSVVEHLSYLLFYTLEYDDDAYAPLTETVIVQRLLIETLTASRVRIYEGKCHEGAYSVDILLYKRMKASGWCPKTIDFI